MSRYEEAKKIYAQYGVDTEAAMERLAKLSVSVHCWQGDDVIGFDGSDSLDVPNIAQDMLGLKYFLMI